MPDCPPLIMSLGCVVLPTFGAGTSPTGETEEGMEEEAHYRSALVCNRRAMRRRRAFAGLLFAYAYALLFVSLSPPPFLPLPFPTLQSLLLLSKHP